MATSTKMMAVNVKYIYSGDADLDKENDDAVHDIAVTVAVNARYAGVKYIDMAHTSQHTLETSGECTINDIIDTELLLADNSVHVPDDWLYVSVFVQPLHTPQASVPKGDGDT